MLLDIGAEVVISVEELDQEELGGGGGGVMQ